MSVAFFCKHKTAYEMRISDWSSDVCSSDLCRLKGPSSRAPVRVGRPQRHRRSPNVRLGSTSPEGSTSGAKGDREYALIPSFRETRKIERASCRERECPYV